MNIFTDSGANMRLDILNFKLRPTSDGCGFVHRETGEVFALTNHNRLVRQSGGSSQVHDRSTGQFVALAGLAPGESIDRTQPFTIEQLSPGITEHIRNMPFNSAYLPLLQPPRPASTPVPQAPRARPAFVPRATPTDYMGNPDIQATRDALHTESQRRFFRDGDQVPWSTR